MEIKVEKIDLVFTKHSIKRMRERGGNFGMVVSLLKRLGKHSLVKKRRGYEIVIPFKGRLVGDFDDTKLIVKSYQFPKFADYGNARKQSIRISHIFRL